jgi:alkanesulfonate monooxygenase SsuD/methylene tetrahydromethanopterin reductase-like flavin-dependent oxidoreductase (luciferase family)
MDAALERLAELGDAAPPAWVGGFAAAAVQRAGRLGLGIMLPSTFKPDQLRVAIEEARAAAADAGRTVRIGVMKYAWATDGSDRQHDWAVEMLGRSRVNTPAPGSRSRAVRASKARSSLKVRCAARPTPR